jgi:hypothetical protein
MDFTTWEESLSYIDTNCQVSEFYTKSSSFLGARFTLGAFYNDHGRLEDAKRTYNDALTGKEKSREPDRLPLTLLQRYS